jgi:hypothetical protein
VVGTAKIRKTRDPKAGAAALAEVKALVVEVEARVVALMKEQNAPMTDNNQRKKKEASYGKFA